jgi:hypothetical protein
MPPFCFPEKGLTGSAAKQQWFRAILPAKFEQNPMAEAFSSTNPGKMRDPA